MSVCRHRSRPCLLRISVVRGRQFREERGEFSCGLMRKTWKGLKERGLEENRDPSEIEELPIDEQMPSFEWNLYYWPNLFLTPFPQQNKITYWLRVALGSLRRRPGSQFNWHKLLPENLPEMNTVLKLIWVLAQKLGWNQTLPEMFYVSWIDSQPSFGRCSQDSQTALFTPLSSRVWADEARVGGGRIKGISSSKRWREGERSWLPEWVTDRKNR